MQRVLEQFGEARDVIEQAKRQEAFRREQLLGSGLLRLSEPPPPPPPPKRAAVSPPAMQTPPEPSRPGA